MCMVGYFLIILFIGYSNFQRFGEFFVIPYDQKQAGYVIIAHILNDESYEDKDFKRKKWIVDNNINLDDKTDRMKLADYEHNYFKKSLTENPIGFIKIHIWKSLQGLILNPFETKNSYKNDKGVPKYWEKYHYLYFYKIPYALLIYLICFIGLLAALKNNEKNLSILILLIVGYYVSILGWVGTSRYMVPNLIFLSIFFGFGLNSLVKYFLKKKNYL